MSSQIRPEPQDAPLPVSPRLIAESIAAEINAARGYPIDQALTGFDLLWSFGEFLRRLPEPSDWQPWFELAVARHRAQEHLKRKEVLP